MSQHQASSIPLCIRSLLQALHKKCDICIHCMDIYSYAHGELFSLSFKCHEQNCSDVISNDGTQSNEEIKKVRPSALYLKRIQNICYKQCTTCIAVKNWMLVWWQQDNCLYEGQNFHRHLGGLQFVLRVFELLWNVSVRDFHHNLRKTHTVAV